LAIKSETGGPRSGNGYREVINLLVKPEVTLLRYRFLVMLVTNLPTKERGKEERMKRRVVSRRTVLSSVLVVLSTKVAEHEILVFPIKILFPPLLFLLQTHTTVKVFLLSPTTFFPLPFPFSTNSRVSSFLLRFSCRVSSSFSRPFQDLELSSSPQGPFALSKFDSVFASPRDTESLRFSECSHICSI